MYIYILFVHTCVVWSFSLYGPQVFFLLICGIVVYKVTTNLFFIYIEILNYYYTYKHWSWRRRKFTYRRRSPHRRRGRRAVEFRALYEIKKNTLAKFLVDFTQELLLKLSLKACVSVSNPSSSRDLYSSEINLYYNLIYL